MVRLGNLSANHAIEPTGSSQAFGIMIGIPLTAYIRLLRNRGICAEYEAASCVGWAISTLEAGRDGSGLRILASLEAPFSYPEVQNSVDRAFEELNVATLRGADAVTAYGAELIQAMLRDTLSDETALGVLRDLCREHDYQSDLVMFYQIQDALDELPILPEVDRNWRGATREDVLADFRRSAIGWLEQYQSLSQR